MNLKKLCEQTSNQLMLQTHSYTSNAQTFTGGTCAKTHSDTHTHLSRNRVQSIATDKLMIFCINFLSLFIMKSKRNTCFSGLISFLLLLLLQKLQILLAFLLLLLLFIRKEKKRFKLKIIQLCLIKCMRC